jgi:hypothetical protein
MQAQECCERLQTLHLEQASLSNHSYVRNKIGDQAVSPWSPKSVEEGTGLGLVRLRTVLHSRLQALQVLGARRAFYCLRLVLNCPASSFMGPPTHPLIHHPRDCGHWAPPSSLGTDAATMC